MTARLTWWGHATCTWLDGGVTVLTDPVLTRSLMHLRRVRGPVPPPRAARADVVLVSHLHADHAHLPSLRRVPSSAVLIAPRGSRRLFRPVIARGVDLVELGPEESVETCGLRVTALAADHDGRRLPGSPHRGPALGFLVTGSRRLWYPGDTGPRIAVDQVIGVDVALVPVGGWGPNLGEGHLDPGQAAEVVRSVRPTHAVPVHWGTWWPIGWPERRALIDDPGPRFAEHISRLAPETSVQLLRHGETMAL